MSQDDDDARVREGMARQLELRATLTAAGARRLGWKAGFGSPPAMASVGLDAPVAGFLTDRTLLADGAEVDVSGWTEAAVEVELAARMAADLPGGADRDAAAAAIGALAPAIELVDLDLPRGPDDLADVLAGNVFHRHVLLGAFRDERAGGATDGLTVSVEVDGAAIARDADPVAATGPLPDVVRAIADRLAAAGEALRAGDVVICGAAVPIFAAEPGARVAALVAGLGDVAVAFAAAAAAS